MNPKKKVKWAEECLDRTARLLPLETTVRMTYRHDGENTATCVAEPEYFRALVNANLEDLHTRKAIAQHVFHEVVHIPIWPLYDVAMDLSKGDKFARKQVRRTNEFTTTSLELMFFKLVFPEFEDE